MQVEDLNGNTSNWQLGGGVSRGTRNNKSSLHLEARRLIRESFPTVQILEEIPISIRRGETLYLDFYIPLMEKCIEVHGKQHYKFSRFYHHTTLGFMKHKKRDREKMEWCEINNIDYIELPYDKQSDWETIILS